MRVARCMLKISEVPLVPLIPLILHPLEKSWQFHEMINQSLFDVGTNHAEEEQKIPEPRCTLNQGHGDSIGNREGWLMSDPPLIGHVWCTEEGSLPLSRGWSISCSYLYRSTQSTYLEREREREREKTDRLPLPTYLSTYLPTVTTVDQRNISQPNVPLHHCLLLADHPSSPSPMQTYEIKSHTVF